MNFKIYLFILALFNLPAVAKADIFGSHIGGIGAEAEQAIKELGREVERSVEQSGKVLDFDTKPPDQVNRLGLPPDICRKYPDYPGCFGSGFPGDRFTRGIIP